MIYNLFNTSYLTLFVCLFFVLAGVVPSLDTNNDEVVDVLYRVQAMRLADAPRPRNTTAGAGYSPMLEM